MRIGQTIAACMLAFALAATVGAAQAADQTYVMKVTLPTINDALHLYGKNLAAAVEKDTGGRIKGEVYPASQLGSIPRQIEGVQFGSIQVAAIPPEFYVGLDPRFEVLTAPGLVSSMDQAERVVRDPAVETLMLGLGANKGLHGVGLFPAQPSSVIAKSSIRHLADFKGKKLRIFASEFQSVALERLGATPVAMSLGDVLPALQQGAIDGSIAGLAVYANMHYQDVSKFVTETGQPFIFIIVEISRKWEEALPPDLRAIVDRDAAQEAKAIYPKAVDYYQEDRKRWVAAGGELISLPPDEQATMIKTLVSVGADVSKAKPDLAAAYAIVSGAAQRAR